MSFTICVEHVYRGKVLLADVSTFYVVCILPSYRVVVDGRLCKGCGICVEICPRKVLVLNGINPETGYRNPVQKDDCIGCRLCMWFCPDQAIAVIREGGSS